MLTLPVVRAWDPAAVTTAGAGIATSSATRYQHCNALSWQGVGTDAALAAVQRIGTTDNRTSTALVAPPRHRISHFTCLRITASR